MLEAKHDNIHCPCPAGLQRPVTQKLRGFRNLREAPDVFERGKRDLNFFRVSFLLHRVAYLGSRAAEHVEDDIDEGDRLEPQPREDVILGDSDFFVAVRNLVEVRVGPGVV